MKLQNLAVAVAGIFIFALLIGCGEQRAEKEFARISAKEADGGPPQLLLAEYQSLLNKYPGTKAAGRAQERIAALKLKCEEQEQQQKADNESVGIVEKESASVETNAVTRTTEELRAVKSAPGHESVVQTVDPERQQQMEALRTLMFQAAKGKARVLHPNYEVTGVVTHKDETAKTGDDGKSFSLEQIYRVSLVGGFFGVEPKSVLLECAGTTRFNERSQRFDSPRITKSEAVADQ